MLGNRQWRLDLAAAVLFIVGVALAVAVVSHDVADQADIVFPPNSAPKNLLGAPGAWASGILLQALGIGTYVFLISWFVLVLLLFLRRDWLRWSRRIVGCLVLVPAVAVLAAQRSDSWQIYAPAGPGGTVGLALAHVLKTNLNPVAPAVFVAAAFGLGIALALDALLRPLPVAGWRCAKAAGRVAIRARGWLALLQLSRPATQTTETPSPPVATHSTIALQSASGPRPIPVRHHAAALNGHAGDIELSAANGTDPRRFADYQLPSLKLLEDPQPVAADAHDQALRDRALLLEKTFADFGLTVRVVGINTGPVVTQFEIALETGLRVHKVTRLADDVALNLKAPSVRIVAPIPGKNTVGVEIPNERRADVRLKEVILASGGKIAKSKIPLFLGKDSEGRPMVYDLADMPHLLIAGTTGTGKSVCMNALILSLLLTRRPDEVRMVMIDPKGGVELNTYERVPHMMHPVVDKMDKAAAILGWAVDKMEERYDLLRRTRVRNIAGYNELGYEEILRRTAPLDEEERKQIPQRMPYIVIFVDEMADLILQKRKEVEGHIIRLAQKSRAAGIHLVLATQKPTVDVITGLIKSNLPARICFKVASKSDSRVVLDEMGADKLLGKGDMLLLEPGTSNLVRAQGTYASNKEIEHVAAALEGEPCYAPELVHLPIDNDGGPQSLLDRLRERDPLYSQAVEVIIREQRGSVSLLQRTLGIGYGRAARLVDFMAEDGIVGAYNGSNAREVLYTPEQWAALRDGANQN
jgi:S-DNA-T family DNA segregation ATPase FtsK/SpoIIIE